MLTATMAGQTAGTRQKRKRPMMMEFHAVSQLEVTAVFSVTCECRLYLFPTDLWVGPVLFDPAISSEHDFKCYCALRATYVHVLVLLLLPLLLSVDVLVVPVAANIKQ